MDKYEYKVRSEEIRELIAQKEYVQAAEIADTIDWRRVKSVMMLCTISDLYKINRRYEDSRDLLLLAYDRHPGGRTIVYALCELAIKMGELPQAVEYCKEFVQIAPKDPGRYILQYKIYEAQEVGLEERIAVLEELKKRDYREKWAYELAYLYHRIGLASKCVDECDEMIVWFGDGKYVIKAMELKMLHQPLTEEQQWKYDNRFAPEEEISEEAVEEQAAEEQLVEELPSEEVPAQTMIWSAAEVEAARQEAEVELAATRRIPVEEMDIQVKTMDPGQCNTINLQEEVAAGLREILEGKSQNEEITRTIMAPMMETDNIDRENVKRALEEVVTEDAAVVMEEPDEALENPAEVVQEMPQAVENATEAAKEAVETVAEAVPEVAAVSQADTGEASQEKATETIALQKEKSEAAASTENAAESTAAKVIEQLRKETVAEPPKEMAKVLSMEADGQLSLVMPEKEAVEKQITGQISIEDIMAEWERMKKELEEKGKEKVRQHVKENTGQMFTEFEASMRDGLLEQLEKGKAPEAVIAQAEGRALEADEIPVPPSLLEEEEVLTLEDEVEELAEIEELTESQDEETVAKEEDNGAAIEEVTEAIEETEAAQIPEQPEEVAEAIEKREATQIPEQPEEIAEAIEETEAAEIPEQPEEVAEAIEERETAQIPEQPEEETEAAEIPEQSEEVAEAIEETEAIEAPEMSEALEEILEEAGEEASIPEPSEEAAEGTKAEKGAVTSRERAKVRNLTKEERELFTPYIQGRSSKEQLIHALDNISMAAYTGNVIITGAEGLDTLGLAKNIIRDIQMTDSNFSGKIAKISGDSLNKREVNAVLDGLKNGALIIQKAADMNAKTVEVLYKALQQEQCGMVVILEGTKKSINAFLEKNTKLHACFTARIDMEALSDVALVAFGKKYAREKECSIDEFGVLALHQIITDRQTVDHAVTLMEVKEIMDEAIESANRKSVGHFFDILMAKRYDDEDMIIIREKDFM